MSFQQDLFPAEASPPASPQAQTEPPAPVWLQRLSMVVLILFCFYVGLLMFLLPWTQSWTENHFWMTWPWVGRVMTYGFTRGVFSGIGLLDWWIGISEIVHYREYRG